MQSDLTHITVIDRKEWQGDSQTIWLHFHSLGMYRVYIHFSNVGDFRLNFFRVQKPVQSSYRQVVLNYSWFSVPCGNQEGVQSEMWKLRSVNMAWLDISRRRKSISAADKPDALGKSVCIWWMLMSSNKVFMESDTWFVGWTRINSGSFRLAVDWASWINASWYHSRC